MTNQDTRKRLIINRHIAKMSPEEIARRFITAYIVPLATEKQRRTQPRAQALPQHR
jgi:hypothetical protein